MMLVVIDVDGVDNELPCTAVANHKRERTAIFLFCKATTGTVIISPSARYLRH